MADQANPYQFISDCISGKWKMMILHLIHQSGAIRFNETKATLGISEKVLSQQLKALTENGLIERIRFATIPPKVEYVLTPLGEGLIPALDILYAWAVCHLEKPEMPAE